MAKCRCKVIKMVLKIYSEIPLDKNMQHIATSQLVYIEIQLTGFCMMQAFIERFSRKERTERTLWERTEEHAYKSNNQKEQSAIYEQLLTCEHYNHIVDLFNVDNNSFNLNKFNICQIRNNTTVIDKANNWDILLFKEAYMIKTHRPSLSCGLKASKELQLF